MKVGGASATAFAPASVGNVAVGFDVLGLSVAALGDRVRAVRRPEPGVAIRSVTGVVHDLPLVAERNTAGMAVLAMQRSLDLPFGFDLDIEKGIPLGSGLGGSAASAVAGVVAAAALIERPVPMTELLKFAMQGEAVASGAVHVDNIAPSLYGGLVLTVGIDNPHVKQIPVPEGVRCVVVHPQRQRLMFVMKHQEGMTCEEIADHFGTTVGTVKKTLFRIVEQLRRHFRVPVDIVREGKHARLSEVP